MLYCSHLLLLFQSKTDFSYQSLRTMHHHLAEITQYLQLKKFLMMMHQWKIQQKILMETTLQLSLLIHQVKNHHTKTTQHLHLLKLRNALIAHAQLKFLR